MANPTRVRHTMYVLRKYRGGFVFQELIQDTDFQTAEVTQRSGQIMPPDFFPPGDTEIQVDPLSLTADELGECIQFMNREQVEAWSKADPRKGAYFGKYMARFRTFNKAE